MQFEVAYGRQLCATRVGVDTVDTSNTTSTALSNIIKQMEVEGDQHLSIASNIELLVLKPFSKWCKDHKERIKYSETILMDNVKNFQKSIHYVNKLSTEYLKNCKKLEDLKRLHFNDDQSYTMAIKNLNLLQRHEINLQRERDNEIFGTIGSIQFDNKSLKQLLQILLQLLPKTEYKLPLINYNLQNTNNGHEITKFLLEHMSLSDFDQAENFGQDLLNLGFIKYCNGVGNNFVNSKKFQYQWKDYAYTFAQVNPTTNKIENRNDSVNTDNTTLLSTLSISNGDNKEENSNTNNNNDNNSIPTLEAPILSESENELFKLLENVSQSDSKYFKECHKMDSLRCSIEELMIDHLSFMEKCEIDRLKAIKKATMDFCSTMGNKISILKLQIDKMIEYEDSIDPMNDLMQLITTYNTGLFQPKVITYNNYYNPGIYQNFGIDLETRCRLDQKSVPMIIIVLLSCMDQIYPELENDKVRVSLWINPVKLSLTHELRNKLNKTQFKEESEILEILTEGKYDSSVIASVIKIYLLELPEALIPNELMDILRALYLKYPPAVSSEENQGDNNEASNEDENENKRITGLYTTLASLSKPHLATLDAIMTHFYRLNKIIKMAEPKQDTTKTTKDETKNETTSVYVSSEEFVNEISREFANCIIHAKVFDDNNLGFKIFHDLLTQKKVIFKQLKRQTSTSK